MSDFFSRLQSHDVVAIVAVGGGLLIAAIALIVTNWRRVRITEMEASLKQQMLEKGMSAAEIEQVLRASKESGPCGASWVAKSPAPDRSTLVHVMTENGYSGEDIERILRAFDASAASADGSGRHESIIREKGAIAHNLVENGMEAADIERVLLAFDSRKGQPFSDSSEKRPGENASSKRAN